MKRASILIVGLLAFYTNSLLSQKVELFHEFRQGSYSGVRRIHAIDSVILISGYDNTGAIRLYRTNGSETAEIKNATLYSEIKDFYGFAETDNRTYFIFRDRLSRERIGYTDGDSWYSVDGGLAKDQLKDLIELFVYKNQVYFTYNNSKIGSTLFKVVGDSVQVAAKNYSDLKFFDPEEFIEHDDRLFFRARSDEHGLELFYFHNDSVGVYDMATRASGSDPRRFVVYHDTLIFVAETFETGDELYAYYDNDVFLFADLLKGRRGSNCGHFTLFDDGLYFVSATFTAGAELMRYKNGQLSFASDSTKYKSVDAPISNVVATNNELLCVRTVAVPGLKLWRHLPGRNKLERISVPTSAQDYMWQGEDLVIGGHLYFAARGASNGTELWVYDGWDVKEVADIYPGGAGSNPHNLILFDSLIYFVAADLEHGYELWRLQPVPSSTQKPEVKNGRLYPNPASDVLHIANGFQYESVTVRTISGQLLQTIQPVSSTVNTRSMSPGIYILEFRTSTGKVSFEKLIIE